MTAVTADQVARVRDTHLKMTDTLAIVTSGTIYIGTLVNINKASNRLEDADNEADRVFAGVVEEILNDSGAVISAATGNTGGTVKARYSYGHTMLLNVATAARTYDNINKNVFVLDNVTVTDTTGAGTAGVQIKIGYLVEFEASNLSTAWVALRRFGDASAT